MDCDLETRGDELAASLRCRYSHLEEVGVLLFLLMFNFDTPLLYDTATLCKGG